MNNFTHIITTSTLTNNSTNACVIGTVDALCNYNGVCLSDGQSCYCSETYITHNSNGTFCNYKQSSKFVATLLELLMGHATGSGYFYIGQYGLGSGQVILFCACWCIMSCCCSLSGNENNNVNIDEDNNEDNENDDDDDENDNDDNDGNINYACCPRLMILGIIIWWLYATISIALGSVSDGNGAPLYSDFD